MMTLATIQQLIPEQQIARYDAHQHRATCADGTVLAVWHYRQPRQAATVVAATQLCAAEDVAPRVWGADVAGKLGVDALELARIRDMIKEYGKKIGVYEAKAHREMKKHIKANTRRKKASVVR